jgi:tRNA(fMet)-specific endonuclease VapC
MTPYLMDTTHAIALWRNHPALVARVAASAPDAVLHLCVPCVGELWYRIFNTPSPAENERTFHAFLARFQIVEYTAEAAVEFGLVKTALQKIRRPIADVDAQIAAIARAREMTILSGEQHFSAIPKMKVENWLTPLPASH